MSNETTRREQAVRLAAQLQLDPEALFEGAVAAWSQLNPQSASFDRALSMAAAVLTAGRTPPVGRPEPQAGEIKR